MDSRFPKVLVGFCFSAVLAAAGLPVQANQYYTRGPKSLQSHQTSHRFTYANPFYQPRSTPKRLECKPNGQARCLTPKKQKLQLYTRQNTAMRRTKVHPYLRKIYKPKIYRTH